jgi:hypothetical protein
MLVRLIYCSRTKGQINQELMDTIIKAAQRHNSEDGITGLLCYSQDVFIQALEGGRGQVNRLFQRISHDERHHEVTLLDYREIDQRQFANWSMAKVALDKKNMGLLLRHSATSTLDPFSMTGASTAGLLAELSAAGIMHTS